jgi:phospholipid/cholesterol/gamma-HCH transport system substrate-binding protein
MRDDNRNYIIVGVFVIAMLAVLIVWIALLSGRTGATDGYYIVYDNVMGLRTGVEILYEGFPVGLIEDISPEDGTDRRRYRVDVSVKRGWPIPEDSRAAITASGLLSANVIDIRGGVSDENLTPGSEIPGQEAADLMSAMNEAADQLANLIDGSVKPLIEEISMEVPEIMGNVKRFTVKLNDTAERVGAILDPTNVERVGSILENLDNATGEFDTLLEGLGETRHEVDGLIAKLDRLFAEDKGELGDAIADLKHTLESIARHIDAITANLEETTRNVNEFSRQIRENPGVIIRGRETDDDT